MLKRAFTLCGLLVALGAGAGLAVLGFGGSARSQEVPADGGSDSARPVDGAAAEATTLRSALTALTNEYQRRLREEAAAPPVLNEARKIEPADLGRLLSTLASKARPPTALRFKDRPRVNGLDSDPASLLEYEIKLRLRHATVDDLRDVRPLVASNPEVRRELDRLLLRYQDRPTVPAVRPQEPAAAERVRSQLDLARPDLELITRELMRIPDGEIRKLIADAQGRLQRIYGDDDERVGVPPQWRPGERDFRAARKKPAPGDLIHFPEAADRTLALFVEGAGIEFTNASTFDGESTYVFQKRLLRQGGNACSRFPVCPQDRYADEPTAAICTAFLVNARIAVTASHCLFLDPRRLVEPIPKDKLRLVAGWRSAEGGSPPLSVPESSVYSIDKIRLAAAPGQDWALLGLTGSVKGMTMAKVRSVGPAVGEQVYTLGHPCGLPLKFDWNATVRSSTGQEFVADLDAFVGNSGSPIFSLQTHEVVGMLIRGQPDYPVKLLPGEQCAKALSCPKVGASADCEGEVGESAAVFAQEIEKFSKELGQSG